ncbi:MAG: MBL fold metallo-hydrolase RNA specificity domain-containing protein [Promethearchaeota archaeon]
MAKITVYDGAHTIGGNKIYFEEGDEGLFLDFGMNFKKYGVFFQEFLSMRAIRGIYDLIALDLIPKLNIYRHDLIPSDLNVQAWPKLKISAILLTHAHVDHFGNIGLLNPNYPVIASPITISLLKAIIDCSKTKLGLDVSYFSPKIPKDDNGKVLISDNKKLEICRDFYSTNKISEKLKEFLNFCPKKTKSFKTGKLLPLEDFSSKFKIHSFNVDHSIYGATAYIIEGDCSIAYTGDFRINGKKKFEIDKFVKKATESDVLIIEGTQVSRESNLNVTEKEVHENCLKVADNAKGLIIADFTSRNIERLETFKDISSSIDRSLIITCKDAYLLKALESVDGINRLKNVLIYEELKKKRDWWEEKLIESISNNIDQVSPEEISRNQDNYLLCFSLYDLKNLLDINPKNGTYIYSSSEAFEEESEFDFIRLNNWLKHFNFKVHGFEIQENNNRPKFIAGFHASGHASREDIIKIIETIDPDYLIPVHTEDPEWFIRNFEKTILIEEKKPFSF